MSMDEVIDLRVSRSNVVLIQTKTLSSVSVKHTNTPYDFVFDLSNKKLFYF